MSVECYDAPLTFYDTHIFSFLVLLVHIIKFNVYDTSIEIDLRPPPPGSTYKAADITSQYLNPCILAFVNLGCV